MNRIIILFLFLPVCGIAQSPDQVFNNQIKSIRLSKYGNQYSYPVIALNSPEQLELHFDDLDGDVKNYYYSYELRNADWSPTLLRSFDYIRGFQDVRITNYRNSSLAFTRYTHYQAIFPDRNCMPTRSGNYLLKVFLNGDTSQLIFTQRFFVYDDKAKIAVQVLQPFSGQLYQTHQRLKLGIATSNQVNSLSPQDVKVVVVQNSSWPTARFLDKPDLFRGNYFEYINDDKTAFPAGKEWRWLDFRSIRLMSDRMVRMEKNRNSTEVFVKPDAELKGHVYVYYRDLDGRYTIETDQNINPYWQGDYATVHFTYFPPGNQPYEGKALYVYGELTGYSLADSMKMTFNAERGAYEKDLFLKQGYYNYKYLSVATNSRSGEISFSDTEGDYWGTENNYMIFVYYRSFGARADELIGYATVNSAFQGQ